MTDGELRALVAGIIPVIRAYVEHQVGPLRAELKELRAEREKEEAETVKYFATHAARVREEARKR